MWIIKYTSKLIKHFLISAVIGTIPGLLLACFMMYLAWDHNPQGEFFNSETGIVNWTNWFTVGIAWFLPVYFITTILCFMSLLIANSIKFLSNKTDKGNKSGGGKRA